MMAVAIAAAMAKERRRNKWVEEREVNGVFAEYLMVNDGDGFPCPHQRVIRFTDEALQRWEDAFELRYPRYTNRWKGLGAMLISFILWPRERQRNQQLKHTKEQILLDSGYVDIPEKDADTINSYPYTPYVILSKAWPQEC